MALDLLILNRSLKYQGSRALASRICEPSTLPGSVRRHAAPLPPMAQQQPDEAEDDRRRRGEHEIAIDPEARRPGGMHDVADEPDQIIGGGDDRQGLDHLVEHELEA